MPFHDILKKKEKLTDASAPPPPATRESPFEAPEFTFMRSDTHTQEIISPPTFDSIESGDGNVESKKGRSRSSSAVSTLSTASTSDKKHKSLSERLHLRKSQIASSSVPSDLPEINDDTGEAWENRATMLARENERSRSRPASPTGPAPNVAAFGNMFLGGKRAISSEHVDDNIQEAIRLHEAGDLETSTRMFGRLADPNGENNALSQVLYGLALRHGWGIPQNATEAVTYLSAAASNAASIEELALQAGMKKGGAAKGELVLAIFELANCFRHGLGVHVDKLAALRYYEVAANMGDTGKSPTNNKADAMNETGWCYLEGFGCKKDKWAAAKYYRLAEQAGSKTLGNSW
ncbi:Protein DSF2 [Lachnellula suecica]|uniref:Protein DSF2 n=1 Tax=Lachnellula suecica TaxID=602035 RepID=A0A8T9CNR2_9HELO|nr:Protein DSF2 [Lachnellula suecica]